MNDNTQAMEPHDQEQAVDGESQADKAPGRDPWCPPDKILSARQLSHSVPLPGGLSEEDSVRLQEEAIHQYVSLEPRDGSESVIARLVVASTNASMENFRRSNMPGITVSGREIFLKLAVRAGTLAMDLLKALDARRGLGRQSVAVGHVNVETGGQAIVGHVQSGARKEASGVDPGQQGDPGPGAAVAGGETIIDSPPQAKPKG